MVVSTGVPSPDAGRDPIAQAEFALGPAVPSACYDAGTQIESLAMPELAQSIESHFCAVKMSDGQSCGRTIYPMPSNVDDESVCLMHSCDPDKDQGLFRKEIHAILNGTSVYRHSKDRYDFTRFVFKEAHFQSATFGQRADFSSAKFIEEADFTGAEFHGEAHFSSAIFSKRGNFVSTTFHLDTSFVGAKFIHDANFLVAKFAKSADFLLMICQQDADFIQATFGGEANFSKVTFSRSVFFTRAIFKEAVIFDNAIIGPKQGDPTCLSRAEDASAVAYFWGTEFLKPDQVQFLKVNKNCVHGLRARFVNCNMERVRFEDVNWYREKSRMVLQDELDRRANLKEADSYEQVAIAYRRLISNFENSRAYDLAEDCSIGAMEMKRLDPDQPIFVRLAVNLYRWASNYGSSYQRALGVLALMVMAFGLLYSLAGLTPKLGQTVLEPVGLIHAVEVATFRSETHAIAGSGLAWFLEILERALIPAQVALFLLALRRRFRR